MGNTMVSLIQDGLNINDGKNTITIAIDVAFDIPVKEQQALLNKRT